MDTRCVGGVDNDRTASSRLDGQSAARLSRLRRSGRLGRLNRRKDPVRTITRHGVELSAERRDIEGQVRPRHLGRVNTSRRQGPEHSPNRDCCLQSSKSAEAAR